MVAVRELGLLGPGTDQQVIGMSICRCRISSRGPRNGQHASVRDHPSLLVRLRLESDNGDDGEGGTREGSFQATHSDSWSANVPIGCYRISEGDFHQGQVVPPRSNHTFILYSALPPQHHCQHQGRCWAHPKATLVLYRP